MPPKYARISAGIVLGCVLVILCASAVGRDALQGETPKAAQFYECMPLPWGQSYCIGCGGSMFWPAGNEIKENYTVCAGFDHAINITWDSHSLYTTYVKVSIGATQLARNASGNIFLRYDQLPATKENVTFTNENGTIIDDFDYEVLLTNQYSAPVMTTAAPIQGGGVALTIAYAAVIVLGIASFKLPQKVRILALIGNIVMPIVWFGGLAMNKVQVMNLGGMSFIIGSSMFTVPENGGLVFTAAIDFDYSDPYYMGFEYMLTKGGDWLTGMPVYYGEFGVGSGFEGYESETGFLPLPPGVYSLQYTNAPSPRMEVGIYVLGAWSDIAPTTSIGMWRWAFLIIGICAAGLTIVAIVRAKMRGKTTKIIPKPAMQGTGGMIDVPFSAISAPTGTAPPAPVATGFIVSWTCEGCGKGNEETAKFCIGCGKARRAG